MRPNYFFFDLPEPTHGVLARKSRYKFTPPEAAMYELLVTSGVHSVKDALRLLSKTTRKVGMRDRIPGMYDAANEIKWLSDKIEV